MTGHSAEFVDTIARLKGTFGIRDIRAHHTDTSQEEIMMAILEETHEWGTRMSRPTGIDTIGAIQFTGLG